MKIACIGYRDWALNIYYRIQRVFTEHEFLVQDSLGAYSEKRIREFSPDLVLFYGWSSLISDDFVRDFRCLMLHPSPLPKYRGGSPIQNQIIRGEVDSAVTIFLMDAGIDTGPISRQSYLSLEGSLDSIFQSITDIGVRLTSDIIENGTKEYVQNHSKASQFKRLRPEMSEITAKELAEADSRYLSNKIRMLQDPYPNPFIRTKDGKKLYILSHYIGA